MKLYLSALITFLLNQNDIVSSFISPLSITNNAVLQQQRPISNNIISATTLNSSSDNNDETTSASADESPSSPVANNEPYIIPYEENSHDELIYTLGINLARQLGDVRPLC